MSQTSQNELEKCIEEMTNRLLGNCPEDEWQGLGFLYHDSKKTCGVCGNTKAVETKSYGEVGVEERYENCPVCGLYTEFIYGYTTVSIEGMGWSYGWQEKETDDSYIQRKKETKIVARILGEVHRGGNISDDEMRYLEKLEERSRAI